jgi:hypothetical protein
MEGTTLKAIRTRVERLARAVVVSACGGNHSRLKLSHVDGEEAAPEWPQADAPTHCGCGAALDYRHVVHQYFPEMEHARQVGPVRVVHVYES